MTGIGSILRTRRALMLAPTAAERDAMPPEWPARRGAAFRWSRFARCRNMRCLNRTFFFVRLNNESQGRRKKGERRGGPCFPSPSKFSVTVTRKSPGGLATCRADPVGPARRRSAHARAETMLMHRVVPRRVTCGTRAPMVQGPGASRAMRRTRVPKQDTWQEPAARHQGLATMR